MLSVTGTSLGRVFLAGKDGCLYEVVYQVGLAVKAGRNLDHEPGIGRHFIVVWCLLAPRCLHMQLFAKLLALQLQITAHKKQVS